MTRITARNRVLEIPLFNLEQPSADVTVLGDLCHVGEIATRNVVTCKPEDEIHEALQTTADKQVRCLPVVNEQGVPQGILSMDDIITYGDLNKWQGCCELSAEEIIRALKRLYGQRPPAVRSHAAVG